MLRFRKHVELMEAGLNAGNLKRGSGNDQKYIDIWHLFLKNIQTKGHEFQTTDGKMVRLDVSSVKNIIGNSTDPKTVFDNILKAGGGSYLLPVAGGGTINLKELEKTAEYGGKASIKGATGALPEWYEESIAVEYNKLKGMKHETAVDMVFGGDKKGMSDYEGKTKIKDFVEIGAKVAQKLNSHIQAPELFHSGKGISGTINHYGERDITPKSDIYGSTTESRISVKMASSNSGAQIMSGKGGDSGGVMKGALAHYFQSKESTEWLEKNKELAKLAEDTSALIHKNYTNVYGVGTTKKGFQDWWMKSQSDDAVQFANNNLKRGMVFYNAKGKQVAVTAKVLEKHVHSLVRKTRVITGIASDSANLLYLDADGEVVWDSFEGYVSDEVAQVEIERGSTPASIYADAMVIRYVESEVMAKNAKDGISDILRNATYGKIFEDRFKSTLEKNEDLHKWIVYEAASGHYKFSGEVADPDNPMGVHSAIAHSFLVFDKTGFKEFENVWVWSQGHTDILSDCNLVFKSSGQTKYLALRVKAVADDVEDLVDHVIQEEYNRVFTEEYLVEFRRIKQMFKKGFDLVKAIGAKVNKFISAVVERVKNLVVTIAKGGFNALLEFFGLEVSGTATLKTPSW